MLLEKPNKHLLKKKMALKRRSCYSILYLKNQPIKPIEHKTNNTEISATSIKNKVALHTKISKTLILRHWLHTEINPLEEILKKKRERRVVFCHR
jgi:hypothetical protein